MSRRAAACLYLLAGACGATAALLTPGRLSGLWLPIFAVWLLIAAASWYRG